MEHISAILANCWWMILLSALIAYLLGSINTAVLVTGIVTKGKKDIRQMGSGNAGFTNVLRSVGKVPAIITIVCDALKCIIAVLIGGFIFSFASVAFQGESPIFINELINCGKYVAGIFCILGHSYPVYFHFKGGKGVVTAALDELVAAGNQYDLVITIGPLIMMKFVVKTCQKHGLKSIVSMNPIMIDGTGMCGGCRLTVGGETKFACVDGPDFDGDLVDFDEAMARGTMYRPFEAHAREAACNLLNQEVK